MCSPSPKEVGWWLFVIMDQSLSNFTTRHFCGKKRTIRQSVSDPSENRYPLLRICCYSCLSPPPLCLVVTIFFVGDHGAGLFRRVAHVAATLPSRVRVGWNRVTIMWTERRRRTIPNSVIGHIHHALLLASWRRVGWGGGGSGRRGCLEMLLREGSLTRGGICYGAGIDCFRVLSCRYTQVRCSRPVEEDALPRDI